MSDLAFSPCHRLAMGSARTLSRDAYMASSTELLATRVGVLCELKNALGIQEPCKDARAPLKANCCILLSHRPTTVPVPCQAAGGKGKGRSNGRRMVGWSTLAKTQQTGAADLALRGVS